MSNGYKYQIKVYSIEWAFLIHKIKGGGVVKKVIDSGFAFLNEKVTYTKTNLYCYQCGYKEVWQSDEPECFYHGFRHVCMACDNQLTIPITDKEMAEQDTLDKLRSV